MPNKVVVGDIDDFVAKGKVERSAIARAWTGDFVQSAKLGMNLSLIWERSHKLGVNASRQGTQRRSTVEHHRLALGLWIRLVDWDDGAIWLVDRNAVKINPEPCQTIWRLGAGDDGAFDKVALVLLDIETTKDDRAYKPGRIY